MALSAINLWLAALPTTDLVEIFLAMVSLWLLHKLFTVSRLTLGQITAAGLLIGVMSLIKPNVIFVVFGLILMVLSWRWRALPSLTFIPLALYFGYTQLLALVNVRFAIVELDPGKWRTVDWLWQELIYYTPYQMIAALAEVVGNVTNRATLVFGLLLFVAVVVMTVSERYPRRLLLLGWMMFLSIVAFVFVFQYWYETHVIGLMPFIYGAIGLGVDEARLTLEQRWQGHPFRAKAAATVILALPLLHNLVQWAAWSTKFFLRNFFE
jgi:hypothetical protein